MHYLQRALSQTLALLLKPTLSRHTLKFPVLPELPFVFLVMIRRLRWQVFSDYACEQSWGMLLLKCNITHYL